MKDDYKNLKDLIKDEKIGILLVRVHKALKKKFPPHHWNHVSVWSAYNDLHDEIRKGLQ